MALAIGRELDEVGAGFGYGSLAAGADILFAEELLRRGAELHVTLPFDTEDFKAVSVAPAGADWLTRFELCLKAATSVQYSSTDDIGDGILFAFGSRVAMGSADSSARHLTAPLLNLLSMTVSRRCRQSSKARQMKWPCGAIWDWKPRGSIRHGSERDLSETAAASPDEGPTWPAVAQGNDLSRLQGVQQTQGRAIAGICFEHNGNIGRGHRQLWRQRRSPQHMGDGLFLVVNDVSTAARLAVALQKVMAGVPFGQLGLPAEMGLRLGCHLGPIWCLYDPIIKQLAFLGEHVSRTARIEPITPEGTIYVTEEFAALLSSAAPGEEVELDYVGRIPAAKNYGILRMYALTTRE